MRRLAILLIVICIGTVFSCRDKNREGSDSHEKSGTEQMFKVKQDQIEELFAEMDEMLADEGIEIK